MLNHLTQAVHPTSLNKMRHPGYRRSKCVVLRHQDTQTKMGECSLSLIPIFIQSSLLSWLKEPSIFPPHSEHTIHRSFLWISFLPYNFFEWFPRLMFSIWPMKQRHNALEGMLAFCLTTYSACSFSTKEEHQKRGWVGFIESNIKLKRQFTPTQPLPCS